MLLTILIDLTWKLPLVILGFSFGEWILHKYVLHNPRIAYSYRAHAIQHHAQGHNDKRPHLDLILADYAVTLPFLAWAGYRWFFLGRIGGLSGLIAVGSVILFHWVFWNKIHRAIHGAEDNWTKRLPCYDWLERHHVLHHRDVRTNLNVVFPIADYILGTKR